MQTKPPHYAAAILLPMLALLTSTACRPRHQLPDAAAGAPLPTPSVTLHAADLAWRFATAIDNDPEDQAIRQRMVALAHLADGNRRVALGLGRQIADWNRGIVLASAAEHALREGAVAEGAELLREAEAVAAVTRDWPRDRIRMATAKPLVLLQATNALDWLARKYAEDREYSGQIAAAQALLRARQGDLPGAVEHLRTMGGTDQFERAAWRTKGFELLFREFGTRRDEATRAIVADLWSTSADVPGARGHELRLEGVEALVAAGWHDEARERLEAVDQVLIGTHEPPHLVLPAQLRLARLWSRLGRPERTVAVIDILLPACRESLNIDRPALLGEAAEALALAGERARALALFEEAIALAEALVNPRPRRMALCDVALALHRSRLGDGAALAALRRRVAVEEEG